MSVFNFNIGFVGHVDSGKTTLAKALSTTASTAAFDKHPQSQERGITLDLGFSSFSIPMPQSFRCDKYETLQFTLVDCPGHASLLKTVIGGSSIIDMFILVIDVLKGVQTQTAECLVVAEITRPGRMIVALNKCDLLKPEERTKKIEITTKRLRKTLQETSFADVPIVPVSASGTEDSLGVQKVIDTLIDQFYFPERSPSGPLLFSADHCFFLRGQGTILTGTILSGQIKVGDSVEIASIKETRKVKSMQQFRKPVNIASQGDRVGICVSQFDANLLERGLVCSAGALQTVYAAICHVKRVPYYKKNIASKSKMHVSIGHETVLAKCTFFGCGHTCSSSCPLNECELKEGSFCWTDEFVWMDELLAKSELGVSKETDTQNSSNDSGVGGQPLRFCHEFVLLEFEAPTHCFQDSLFIASKLDDNAKLNACRLAFHGRLEVPFLSKDYRSQLTKLRIYREKSRSGIIERNSDEYTVIVSSLFKKETNLELFANLKVRLSSGEHGFIEGGFGQSGKVKVRVPEGLCEQTLQKLAEDQTKKKRRNKEERPQEKEPNSQGEPIKVVLKFKKFVFDEQKKIVQ